VRAWLVLGGRLRVNAMTIRPPPLTIATLATICAGCLSQAIPPATGGGAFAAAAVRRESTADAERTDRREEIAKMIRGSPQGVVLPPAERVHVQALYERHDYRPLWTDLAGRPGPHARQAIALFSAAADDGLEPADYDAASLAAAAGELRSIDPARFDVGMSAAMLRYLRHLHAGRIDPGALGFRVGAPADQPDYVGMLDAAIATGRVAETADAVRPRLWAYAALRRALRQYRALAVEPTQPSLPPHAGTLHAGDAYAGTPELRLLLSALGDLPATEPGAGDSLIYEGPLVAGVKRFQVRHGLDADGVVGPATMRALRTPLAVRVRQIELALERLRWLPHAGGERLVLVNIPMFRLWAWDAMPPLGAPALATDVIVGRALRTHTPVFAAHLREVICRPAWTVPASILRNEMLPAIRRDPDYLRKHGLDVVAPDGRIVDAATHLARIGHGGYGLRQRPGTGNALGLIKFVFPNQHDVYMHDTSARELFNRSRRDFSHGCVRVRDPVALAEWALAGVPAWDRTRILEATSGAQTIRVAVGRSTNVILFYVTAIVTPDEGALRFAEDIYGHDVRLERALSACRAID
jgi:murein L,D-transpeptidase YcbB/YkuD